MPTPTNNRIGLIILAGGHSSRMGRSKTNLPWRGGTLLSNLLRCCQAISFQEILIAANAPLDRRNWPAMSCPLRITADTYTDCGPLGGIEAALRVGSCDYYAILSTDLPFYDFSPLKILISQIENPTRSETEKKPIILPVVSGREQPLAALYPAGIYSAVISALQAHTYRLSTLFHSWPVCRIDETTHAFLYTNINTPSDYKDALAHEVNRHRAVPILSISANQSGSGKTTAAAIIIRSLTDLSYSVGYIKSTHHNHIAAKEGSDTERALKNGAIFAQTCSPDDIPSGHDKKSILYELSQQRPADLVIIESRCHGIFPIMQIIPDGFDNRLPAHTVAVIGNSCHDSSIHHFSLSNTTELITYIRTIIMKNQKSGNRRKEHP